jgi:hypothetical protein
MTGIKKVSGMIIWNCDGCKSRIVPNNIFWKREFFCILSKKKNTRRKALKRKKIPADIGNRMCLMFQSLDNFKFTSKKP